MRSLPLIGHNLRHLFTSWTLSLSAAFYLFIWLIPMGFTGMHHGTRGLDALPSFLTVLNLLLDLAMGFVLASVQLKLLSQPFAFLLPRYTRIAWGSILLMAIALNALFFVPLAAFYEAVSPRWLAAHWLLGVGVFVFPLWVSSFPSMISRYFLLLLPFVGRSLVSLWNIPRAHSVYEPLVAATVGGGLLLLAYRRLHRPAVRQALALGKDFGLLSWGATDRSQARNMQHEILRARGNQSVLENLSERLFRRLQSGPSFLIRLLAGMPYLAASRFTLRALGPLLLLGIVLPLLYSLNNSVIVGRVYIDSFSASVSSLVALLIFHSASDVPPYFFLLPGARQTKARALLIWTLLRVVAQCLALPVFLGLIAFFSQWLEPAASYFYVEGVRHWVGYALLPLFMEPALILLDRIPSQVLKAFGWIAIFLCWPGIPAFATPGLFLLLAGEWALVFFFLRRQVLRHDWRLDREKSLLGWAA